MLVAIVTQAIVWNCRALSCCAADPSHNLGAPKKDTWDAIHSAMCLKYQPKKTSQEENGFTFLCILICEFLKAERHNSSGQLSNTRVNVQLSPRYATGFSETLFTDFCGLTVKCPQGLIKSLHKETVHETLMAVGSTVSTVDEWWIIPWKFNPLFLGYYGLKRRDFAIETRLTLNYFQYNQKLYNLFGVKVLLCVGTWVQTRVTECCI